MTQEILSDLKRLALTGPIKSVHSGSNSIGKTLQAALGIEHSTTARNRYKGFTITSTSLAGSSRTNLFAQVPDWSKSDIHSSTDLVEEYGIIDKTKKYHKKLFCTVNALNPNSFGLFLKVDMVNNLLSECYFSDKVEKSFLVWDSIKLKEKLSNLDKLVIVTASKHKRIDGDYFHFKVAEFLLAPSFDTFLKQIKFGTITLDHLISLQHGSRTAKEQGPLFKISKTARIDLFDNYKKYNLLD